MQQSKTEKQSIYNKSKLLTSRQKTNTSQFANVNSYKHFLAVPSTNQSYIQWAIGLRSAQQAKSSGAISAPPETYYKTIQSRKMKHTSADFSGSVNISQFQHLALHRIGMHPSCGQIIFETTLRQNKNQKMLQKQKKWCSIPKKDRHEDPLLIKSKSLKKKIVQPEQMQAAVDTLRNYPKFTQKIIKNRNCNQFRHMIKGRINLPSIGWQTNLRSY